MSTAAKTERKTNVTLLLETLERRGDLDADALQDATGIKKPIIVSTLFLAKQRGQVDSRPKTMAVLEGRFDFSLDHEATCKKLSRCGWEVPDIAGKLGFDRGVRRDHVADRISTQGIARHGRAGDGRRHERGTDHDGQG